MRAAGYRPETLDTAWLTNVLETVKGELTTLAEIGDHIDLFFDERYSLSKEAERLLASPGAREVIGAFDEYLQRGKAIPGTSTPQRSGMQRKNRASGEGICLCPCGRR